MTSVRAGVVVLGLAAAIVALAASSRAGGSNAPAVGAAATTAVTAANAGGARALASIQGLPVADLVARLEALSPQRPRDYFLLAEELAQEPHEREARQLARTLYALSFELARASGDAALASSSALGLTELSQRSDQRRWLRAIASVAAPTPVRAGVLSAGGPADASALAAQQLARIERADEGAEQRVALDLVTAIGLARVGEGRRAAAFLARPGVRDLLRRYEGVLNEGGMADAEASVQGWIDRWPRCPTCDNRRILRRGDAGRLCNECEGLPGPRLPIETLIAHYRAESMLLRGVQRSFAAQTLADRGEPLRDPEPARLCERLGIDPSLTVFRAGSWVKP
jgi:hypothetical protein